jgi:hypothetical protein
VAQLDGALAAAGGQPLTVERLEVLRLELLDLEVAQRRNEMDADRALVILSVDNRPVASRRVLRWRVLGRLNPRCPGRPLLTGICRN